MGKIGSSSFDVLLVSGYDFLAAKAQSFSHKIESLFERTDGLGDGTEAESPVGVQKLTVTQAGAFFDDTANGMHDALKASTGTIRIMALAFAGNIIGKSFVGIQGIFGMAYDVLGQIGKLTKANATYQSSGVIERGLILQHWTAKTINWNTKTDGQSVDNALDPSQRVIPITSNSIANPTVVTTPVPHGLTSGDIILISGVATSAPTINGQFTATVIDATHFSVPVNVTVAGTGGSFVRANTRNGGAGYLEVSAYSGFTNVVVKIRSSPDDTTYADLITFTTVAAAPIAERIAVAGTVDRYLCVSGTVTGAGSITPFVGFARG